MTKAERFVFEKKELKALGRTQVFVRNLRNHGAVMSPPFVRARISSKPNQDEPSSIDYVTGIPIREKR